MNDWRKQYEDAAEQQAKRVARASDQELLDAIRRRATGDYYVIWYEIAKRKATPETCWLLYEVLLSDRPYLDKYHCASALLALLGCREFEEVELSSDWPVVPANLAKLRGILESKLGPPVLPSSYDGGESHSRKKAQGGGLLSFLREWAARLFRVL